MGAGVDATAVPVPVGSRGPARAPLAAHREVESDRREDRTVDRRADGDVAGGAGGAVVGVLNGNVARLQSPRIASHYATRYLRVPYHVMTERLGWEWAI